MNLHFTMAIGFMASVASLESCVQFSLTDQTSLTSTCGSAVDYPFHLNGTTLASLESAARLQLADSKFIFLSTQCLINYKKLVCSNIYLKCQPGAIISQTSTYNNQIYPKGGYAVPFTRPCQRVCTSVVESCSGLITPNCSAVFDYSYGKHSKSSLPMKYDVSNNNSLCNSVPATFGVASSSEPYLFQKSGACAGLVTNVYIPPGSFIDPSFTYLTPQYMVQSIIEGILVSVFAKIPVYTSAACHFAFRKYFCGQYLIQPQAESVGAALAINGIDISTITMNSSLLLSTFYNPSYPAQSVCQDYSTQCGALIAIANKSNLNPHCDLTVPNTPIQQFPSKVQVVFVASIPIFPKNTSLQVTTRPLLLFSTPNTFSSASDRGYVTNCPEGFVVPDHPESPRNIMIPGSGCAFACRFPIWTISEYATFDLLIRVLSAFGLPMVLYFVISSIADTKKRQTQYLRIIYASTALVLAIFVLSLSNNPSHYFCKDNAIPYLLSYDGATVCTMQGVLFFYGGLINGVAWMILSIDLFLKICLDVKSTTHHLPYHLVIIYVLPAFYSAAIAGSGSAEFGYVDTSSAICSISSKNNTDIYFFYIPILVFNAIGLLAGISVIVAIIRSINNAAATSENSAKRFLVLRTPLFFLTMFITLWGAALAFRGIVQVQSDAIYASVYSWTVCVFTIFDGSNTWKDSCGMAPAVRPSYTFIMFVLTFVGGQGIIITLVFKAGSWYTFAKEVVLSVLRGKTKVHAGNSRHHYSSDKGPSAKINVTYRGTSQILSGPVSIAPKAPSFWCSNAAS